jgi:hypothetical protein
VTLFRLDWFLCITFVTCLLSDHTVLNLHKLILAIRWWLHEPLKPSVCLVRVFLVIQNWLKFLMVLSLNFDGWTSKLGLSNENLDVQLGLWFLLGHQLDFLSFRPDHVPGSLGLSSACMLVFLVFDVDLSSLLECGVEHAPISMLLKQPFDCLHHLAADVLLIILYCGLL